MFTDRVSMANQRALVRYRPRRYDGEIMLVIASERKVRAPRDPRLLWSTLARSFSRVDIPALDSGLALKNPHVGPLAQAMKESLQKIQPKHSDTTDHVTSRTTTVTVPA
jgi:hypothetical protein